MRGLAAGTMLALARSLGEFGATIMVAGNIEGQTRTIPLAIFTLAGGLVGWPSPAPGRPVARVGLRCFVGKQVARTRAGV